MGFFIFLRLGPQLFTKYLRLTLVFMSNTALRESLLFIFLKVLVSTKFLFWQEDWTLGYHSIKFRNFADIS